MPAAMDQAPVIRATVHEGHTFYGTSRDGIEYVTNEIGDQWYLTACAVLPGGIPFRVSLDFPDLPTLTAACSAFAGLDLLVNTHRLCA